GGSRGGERGRPPAARWGGRGGGVGGPRPEELAAAGPPAGAAVGPPGGAAVGPSAGATVLAAGVSAGRQVPDPVAPGRHRPPGKPGCARPRGSARPGWRGTRPGWRGTTPGWGGTGPRGGDRGRAGPGGPAAAAGVASAPANPRTRPDTPANRAILGTMLSLAALRAIYHRRLSRDNTPLCRL